MAIFCNPLIRTPPGTLHHAVVSDTLVPPTSFKQSDHGDDIFTASSTTSSGTATSTGGVVLLTKRRRGYPVPRKIIIQEEKENINLTCTDDRMYGTIDTVYLQSLGYLGENLFLNDRRCQPDVSDTYIAFNVSFMECGTLKEVDNETIFYTNRMQTLLLGNGSTPSKKLHIEIACKMPLYTKVDIMYEAVDTLEIEKLQKGAFDWRFSFYSSRSFLHPITDFPYMVSLNQIVYLEIKLLSSDPDLQIFVDTCKATPDPTDSQAQSYSLIQSGCIQDSSYRFYLTSSHKEARFSFRAFSFLNTFSRVYIECKMAVCDVYDRVSRCKKGCRQRRKRSLDSSTQEESILVGPIQLQME